MQEMDRMRHMWLEAWTGASDGEDAGPPPKGAPCSRITSNFVKYQKSVIYHVAIKYSLASSDQCDNLVSPTSALFCKGHLTPWLSAPLFVYFHKEISLPRRASLTLSIVPHINSATLCEKHARLACMFSTLSVIDILWSNLYLTFHLTLR